jgi:membrane protease subunit (stomatin/prohibitin family)
MKTTLNKIRQHSPCKEGWTKLLKHLGKTEADYVELDLLTILSSNGLDDTLWCLRAVDGFDKEKRLMAVAFAREVQHLMKDPRSIAALDVAERFANGEATEAELRDARAAARDAAFTATYATGGMGVARAAAAVAQANAAVAQANAAAADAADAAYAAAARAYAADAYAAMRQKQVEIFKKFCG